MAVINEEYHRVCEKSFFNQLPLGECCGLIVDVHGEACLTVDRAEKSAQQWQRLVSIDS